MQGISVVVPVFNEEGNVRELHKAYLKYVKKKIINSKSSL